ncbi:MAG: hypothetical protein IH614_13330 [Desulfuromonadales bacterium]|nr:hypothetical protein [Desulfuromonadales bacterium]
MRTEPVISSGQQPENGPEADRCPFYRPQTDSCQAAIPGLRIEWRRQTRCSSEDHDDCTAFLAKILRSSRPKARLEPWPLGQK